MRSQPAPPPPRRRHVPPPQLEMATPSGSPGQSPTAGEPLPDRTDPAGPGVDGAALGPDRERDPSHPELETMVSPPALAGRSRVQLTPAAPAADDDTALRHPCFPRRYRSHNSSVRVTAVVSVHPSDTPQPPPSRQGHEGGAIPEVAGRGPILERLAAAARPAATRPLDIHQSFLGLRYTRLLVLSPTRMQPKVSALEPTHRAPCSPTAALPAPRRRRCSSQRLSCASSAMRSSPTRTSSCAPSVDGVWVRGAAGRASWALGAAHRHSPPAPGAQMAVVRSPPAT